jgi:hypothetical protein
MYSLDTQQGVVSGSAVALTSVADGLIITPGSPIEIIQFGYIMTTVVSGSPTSAFLATLDLRPLAGSDTGRTIGGGSLGTLTLTNAQVLAAQTFGAATANANGPAYVFMSRLTPSTTGDASAVVYPGQQAVLRVKTALTGGSAAGSGIQFICFKNLARLDSLPNASSILIVNA